ncbi:MAG: hypothetical protein NC548_57520 [Lachnospiraceae bacterium]|nr:hypothetical protein [Lachnospiraceae bacterium]
MGVGDSSPVRLFYVDQETGEQKELTQDIAELTISEAKDSESMTEIGACLTCRHADSNRTKDGKIRCKRWSQWVSRMQKSCKEYGYSISFDVHELAPYFLPQEPKGK